jgi:N-acetylmuramoyl-L-alanine amidase
MNIQRDVLTVNPFSRPGRSITGIRALVIHWTGNPGSTAKQNRDYFEYLKTQSLNDPAARFASAHFIVGISGEVIQCIPAEEMAYHAGAKAYTPKALGALGHFPNLCTIGIELCHPGAEGRFSAETLGAAAELCALLCVQSGLNPLADIWTHHDITGKDCPKRFVERPEEFAEFKQGIAKIANWLRG